MHLVFFTTNFKPLSGGVAEHTHRYAEYFHHEGHSVVVVAPKFAGSDAVDRGHPYTTIRIPLWPSPLRQVLFGLTLLRVHRREAIDWVYCPVWFPLGVIAAGLNPLLSYHLAIATHGWELLEADGLGGGGIRALWKPQFWSSLLRPVLASAAVIVAVSEWTRSQVQTIVPSATTVHVINNGVDPAPFETATPLARVDGIQLDDRPVLVTVARLQPRKGQDTVIKALAEIRAAFPDVIYLIAGEGPYRASLEALARSNGVAEAVRFLGYVPASRLPSVYATADLFVMPNRSVGTSVEGFGIVFLEAGAAGLPVVGGRSGGVADAVVDGETGLLVDPERPDAVAGAVIELFGDPEKAAAFGRAGYERVVSRYTWTHAGGQLEAVLGSVG